MNFSGISPSQPDRKGGKRQKVNWRCRFFGADKVIHTTVLTAAFKGGFCMGFTHALPIQTELNLEIANQGKLIRAKVNVDYCLLRSKGDGADIDLLISKISDDDNQILNTFLTQK
jgi:hypothetical protein